MEQTPDFIGIGCPKCGSTWLQFLLNAHPDIFIPKERNEIHYFDRYFEKGLAYYAPFFASASASILKGEITPHYLYIEDPTIIKSVPTIKKMILIYRNPVDRMVSHYKYRVRMENYKEPFSTFIRDSEKAIQWGMYGHYFEKFLSVYKKENILVLKFEDAVGDLAKTKKILADFLGVDANKFPESAGKEVVNQGFIPKNRKFYGLMIKISQGLLKFGLYRLRNSIKKAGLVKGMAQKVDVQAFTFKPSAEEKQYLINLYEADFALFNTLIAQNPISI